MKILSSIPNILKLGIKYGAFIVVIVRVLQFALEEFEKLKLDEKEPAPAKQENDNE
jgi:hypothetical protein